MEIKNKNTKSFGQSLLLALGLIILAAIVVYLKPNNDNKNTNTSVKDQAAQPAKFANLNWTYSVIYQTFDTKGYPFKKTEIFSADLAEKKILIKSTPAYVHDNTLFVKQVPGSNEYLQSIAGEDVQLLNGLAKPLASQPPKSFGAALFSSSDGRYLLFVEGGYFKIYDTTTEKIKSYKGFVQSYEAVAPQVIDSNETQFFFVDFNRPQIWVLDMGADSLRLLDLSNQIKKQFGNRAVQDFGCTINVIKGNIYFIKAENICDFSLGAEAPKAPAVLYKLNEKTQTFKKIYESGEIFDFPIFDHSDKYLVLVDIRRGFIAPNKVHLIGLADDFVKETKIEGYALGLTPDGKYLLFTKSATTPRSGMALELIYKKVEDLWAKHLNSGAEIAVISKMVSGELNIAGIVRSNE